MNVNWVWKRKTAVWVTCRSDQPLRLLLDQENEHGSPVFFQQKKSWTLSSSAHRAHSLSGASTAAEMKVSKDSKEHFCWWEEGGGGEISINYSLLPSSSSSSPRQCEADTVWQCVYLLKKCCCWCWWWWFLLERFGFSNGSRLYFMLCSSTVFCLLFPLFPFLLLLAATVVVHCTAAAADRGG